MANNVSIRTGAPGAKQATGEIKSLRDGFDRLQKQGAKGFGIGVGATATAKAFNLVGSAISTVTDFLGGAKEAYIEDERSVSKLNTSLKANVTGFDGQTGAIERVIKQREKLAFSDEDLRNSLSLLVAATHDTNKAFDLQATAMDLARFKGISLQEASTALVKVEGGQFRALKGLGIVLKEGATQTEALAAVQKVASGQAAAFADTIEGKLTAAEIRLNDRQEDFGKGIAELAANIETTVVDTLDWADALSEAGRLLPGFAHGTDDQREAVKALADTLLHANDVVEDHGDALIGVRSAAAGASGSLDGLPGVIEDEGDAAKAAATKSKAFADMLDRIASAADKLPDKLDDLTDLLFGPAERVGDLAEAQKDLEELLTDGPEKGAKNLRIWKGEVAAARQKVFELQFQMEQKKGPEALDSWLRKQRDSLSKSDQKARDYYNTLIAFNSLNLKPVRIPVRLTGISSTSLALLNKYVPEYASGGIVKAQPGGTIVKVGEGGKDEAIVPLEPDGGMAVSRNRMPGSGGGGSAPAAAFAGYVPVPVPANWTPSQQQAWAQEAGPAIARWMQQRGMLSGARAF